VAQDSANLAQFLVDVMQEAVLLLVLAAAGYGTFSWSTYKNLEVPFNRMRLLAASRMDGSSDEALEAVEGLQATQPSASVQRNADLGQWEPAPGSKSQEGPISDWLYQSEDLQAGRDAKGQLCIQVRALKHGPDLLALLQSTAANPLPEDIATRAQWHRQLQTQGGAEQPDDVLGTWSYCFRDYVNAEELGFMASSRGAFSPLQLRGTGELKVGPLENTKLPTAVLRDTFDLLGLLPFQIEWQGQLKQIGEAAGSSTGDLATPLLELQWDYTEARLGWPPLALKFVRPAAAERLRQEPWEVRARLVSTQRNVPPLLVLYRKGVGSLAYRMC